MKLWDKVVEFHKWSKQYCLCRYFKAWWGKPTGEYEVTHVIKFTTTKDGTPSITETAIEDFIADINTKMKLNIGIFGIKSKVKEIRK